jgi:hypothetical protein
MLLLLALTAACAGRPISRCVTNAGRGRSRTRPAGACCAKRARCWASESKHPGTPETGSCVAAPAAFLGEVDYDGATQAGDPVETTTEYYGLTAEWRRAGRWRSAPRWRLQPLAGLGWRGWLRRIDNSGRFSSGYDEAWNTVYGAARRGRALVGPTRHHRLRGGRAPAAGLQRGPLQPRLQRGERPRHRRAGPGPFLARRGRRGTAPLESQPLHRTPRLLALGNQDHSALRGLPAGIGRRTHRPAIRHRVVTRQTPGEWGRGLAKARGTPRVGKVGRGTPAGPRRMKGLRTATRVPTAEPRR